MICTVKWSDTSTFKRRGSGQTRPGGLVCIQDLVWRCWGGWRCTRLTGRACLTICSRIFEGLCGAGFDWWGPANSNLNCVDLARVNSADILDARVEYSVGPDGLLFLTRLRAECCILLGLWTVRSILDLGPSGVGRVLFNLGPLVDWSPHSAYSRVVRSSVTWNSPEVFFPETLKQKHQK